MAIEWSGLESPPSVPLGIAKPAQGEVLRDKPEDFSWTRELWEVTDKPVLRQKAMDAHHAAMELEHPYDGIIAREQWREGLRLWRVDLNEDGKPKTFVIFDSISTRKLKQLLEDEGYFVE